MLLILAAVVAALSPRPAALSGGDAPACAAWLHQRTLVADRAFGGARAPGRVRIRSPATPRVRQRSPRGAGRGGRSQGPVFMERVRLTGCGRTTVHNFEVVRLRRGGWDAMGTLPGQILSTPRQQTELMQSLAGVLLNGRPALPCRRSEALRTDARRSPGDPPA